MLISIFACYSSAVLFHLSMVVGTEVVSKMTLKFVLPGDIWARYNLQIPQVAGEFMPYILCHSKCQKFRLLGHVFLNAIRIKDGGGCDCIQVDANLPPEYIEPHETLEDVFVFHGDPIGKQVLPPRSKKLAECE